MKILVSSMTFSPDHSGISLYATDFASYAAEQGHTVTAVTSFSWYPKWIKNPEDKGRLFRTDLHKGIKVLRGYLYVPKKVTTITRVLQEITFILFAFINFARAGKHDVIVVFTTPINLGIVGVFFQKLWKAKLTINVQDLQLDAAKTLGMLGKSPVAQFMNSVEVYSYKKADLVTSISNSMISLIVRKGVPTDKVYLWPNWINVGETRSKGIKGDFMRKFNQFKGKMIVGYAGNVGIKQSLTILIDLSEKFKERSDIVFLIIGQGGDLVNLKNYATSKGIGNLHFIDFLSQIDYYNFLSDADIVFLSQKKDSEDAYFPSKLLGIMAKEKLILVAADKESEIYKVVAGNNIGISSEIDNLSQMVTVVEDYSRNSRPYLVYKSNANEFVHQFDREIVLSALFDQLGETVSHTQATVKNSPPKINNWFK